MTATIEKITKENYTPSRTGADTRNVSNSTKFIINEDILRFNPLAVRIIHLLTAALCECRRYESQPGGLGDEASRHTENAITAVLGMETDRLDSIIQKHVNNL